MSQGHMDDSMDGIEESGNPLTTNLPSNAVQDMEVEQGSNYQQVPPSSSSADHQTIQNSQLLQDQAQHSSSSVDPHWIQSIKSLDIYTAGTGGQNSSPPLDNLTHQDTTMDRTRLQPEALTDQMMQSGQFSNVQGISGPVVIDQPLSINGQGLMGRNNKDFSAAGAGSQDFKHSLNNMKHQNNTTGQTNKSESEPKKISPAQIKQSNHQDLQASSAEGQDSGSSLDKQKHQDIAAQTNKSDSQPEEDIVKNGDIYTTQSQHSAPLKMAKFKIKVDWTEPFPERWEKSFEKAIQSWLSKLEGKPSVVSLELMDDLSLAEVQITPSTALETYSHGPVSLNFKHENKSVAAQIHLDDSVTVSQNTSKQDKNGISTLKVNSTKPVTASDDTNNGPGVPIETKTIKKQDHETPPEMSTGLPVPLHQFWYTLHAYRKELELIDKQHGVSLHAEVSVSFKPTQRSSPDSVSKASEDFQKLLNECVDSFGEATINHNDMDSEIVKEALRNIQLEKTKMMLTMSASDCRFFGPKKFTDLIRRETTRVEQQYKDKPNEMDVDSISPQRRSSLDMDMKNLQTQLEMDKVHWDLIKLSYEEQISQLQTKYGVSFHEAKLQKNVIKVQAQSKGFQHINLESHALRALTHLYQKLASAAVSCELKNPKHETDVAPLVEKLQQQHYCVAAADAFSPWKLVGLPEHLGPAIADIEKKLQKHVFDDRMKKLIGYLDDIPHARGIKRNQMPDYGPGAVGGAGRDEGVNFRGRNETDSGFNKEAEENSKHDSKGAHAEEEMCTICMDHFTDKTKLKCGHEFCQECINMSVKSLGSICPVCKEVFGKLEGNQPDGTMNVIKSSWNLPGHPNCGTIEIYYNIPSGVQTEKHPNPGMHYQGASRHAYLPDNNEGNEVCGLLQRAFQQKLIFTVGKSTTSGLDNVVTWNDIHHKTSTHGGPERYGYPDTDYLKRVKDELKAKGIK